MASSALRQSLPRRASLRSALPSHRLPAASEFCRSFQSGDGEISETMDEFEARIFGRKKGVDEGSLYRKVDKVENTSKRYGMGSGFMAGFSGLGNRSSSGSMGGYGAFGNRSSSGPVGGFDSLNDGMNEMLVDVARNFQMDDNNDGDDEFRADVDFRRGFRADVDFRRGGTYNARDLDPRRPAAAKNPPRPQFQTTTAEVLRKADFRNVRFLSNFLTEAGIIFKRSQTGISAKAQRKVAREIKTARAFGLMPFTTMGRKPFIFGRSAEEHYSDEEYGDFVKPGEDNGDAEPDVEAP